MRITSKGQVTIPQPIREAAGLMPNTEIEFRLEGGVVTIVKASPRRGTRGTRAVANLRRHGRTIAMTTDEIMALTRGE
jgi:AbrB family looped-hinge helix DNA binding protein